MFRNVNNIVVTGGHFTNIDNVGTHDAVSTTLCQNVAEGAIFDSAERYAAGKCHPGTREKVIEQITNWINDPDPTQHILWIHGFAGAGKSAIMQTICELLKQTHPERYGGSFFFARDHTERGKGLKLFTTLSYQIALQFPSMRAEVNKALYHDPTLPTKSMEVQLLSLIIQPLLQCHSELPSHSPTLIIDGLDECTEDERVDTHRQIIALISQSIVEYNIPLRFIIASRPEYWIRDTFESSPLLSITLPLSLRDDFDADNDIKAYLMDEFEKIRLANKRVMGSVTTPWPPTNIVNRFVEEASGQYIYASTVLKFVGSFSRFSNPQEQLRIITSPGPHQASAFSELDRLYATILSAYPRWETMKRVLGGILVDANTTIIKAVLGVEPDEVVLVFDALSSLIKVTEPRELTQNHFLLESIYGSILAGRDRISYCHLSFRQFLENVDRSGPFHIDIDGVGNEIIRAYFGMIHSNLDQNYAIEPQLYLNLDVATYNCTMLHVVTGLWRQPRDHQDPEILDEFRTAYHKLKDAAIVAQNKIIRGLLYCPEFKVTPSFVYLAKFCQFTHIYPHDFSRIPGTTDVISTMKSLRHILTLSNDDDRIMATRRLDLNAWFQDGEDMSPCTHNHDEWRNQEIWLALQSLKSILNVHTRSLLFSHNIVPPYLSIPPEYYFVSKSMSDIHDKEYFQNPDQLSILSLITHPSTWNGLVPSTSFLNPFSKDLITPMLCWFNRQLTSPNTLKLLEDYEKGLPQRMTAVMKYLFEYGFLEAFTSSYNTEKLVIFVPTLYQTWSFTIAVLPLPQGFRPVAEEHERFYLEYSNNWCTFHDSVFGKPNGQIDSEGPAKTIIDPSCWHPYFAHRLLNALVQFDPIRRFRDGTRTSNNGWCISPNACHMHTQHQRTWMHFER